MKVTKPKSDSTSLPPQSKSNRDPPLTKESLKETTADKKDEAEQKSKEAIK
jgi:hypothetical protein